MTRSEEEEAATEIKVVATDVTATGKIAKASKPQPGEKLSDAETAAMGKGSHRQIHHPRRRVLLAILSVCLAVICVAVAVHLLNNDGQKDRQYKFINLDYPNLVSNTVSLPFQGSLVGEYNTLDISLFEVKATFPYNNKIFVHVGGEGRLRDNESKQARDLFKVSLRFFVHLSVSPDGILSKSDFEFFKFSAYSKDADVKRDVNVLLDRCAAELWNDFSTNCVRGCVQQLECPFPPDGDIRLENDGVFVYER